MVNVESGRYGAVHLPARHGEARMADIRAIDLRRHAPPRGHWLSPPVVDAMRETLARGEQSLLFLNRRGYAPLTLCRTCGHRLNCPTCTSWLVEHRRAGRLQFGQLTCFHVG